MLVSHSSPLSSDSEQSPTNQLLPLSKHMPSPTWADANTISINFLKGLAAVFPAPGGKCVEGVSSSTSTHEADEAISCNMGITQNKFH